MYAADVEFSAALGLCCCVLWEACLSYPFTRPGLERMPKKVKQDKLFTVHFISPFFATLFFKNGFSHLCPLMHILLPFSVHCLPLQSILRMGNYKMAPELLH